MLLSTAAGKPKEGEGEDVEVAERDSEEEEEEEEEEDEAAAHALHLYSGLPSSSSLLLVEHPIIAGCTKCLQLIQLYVSGILSPALEKLVSLQVVHVYGSGTE